MGGQGALRFAYKHPKTFPVTAAISPALDYHLRLREGDETLAAMYPNSEAARQDTALLHVHPLNWPHHQFFCCDPTDERWWDGADRLRILPWGIDVLTLRDRVADPVRVLTSPGFSGMINMLSADYDVVLFDSSPMLEAAHWQLVAQITDKMLLVVRPGSTTVSEMGLAVRQLSQDDILGVVLNQVQN